MPLLLWLLFEVIAFFVLSSAYGFVGVLLAYWLPTFLIFRLFASSLLGPRNSPWSRIGWTLIGLPFLSTRFLGFFALLPGVRSLLSTRAQEKFQENVRTWQGRTRFSTFYYSNANFANRAEPFEHELKDVTPKKAPQIDLPN